MAAPRFSKQDFQIFQIGEFGHQIGTMRAQVTPKLEAWGEALAGPASELVGETLFPHVARHLRRRTTPPPETWLALGPNQRGYKKDPVLGLCVSRDGVQARVMLKHEGFALRKRLPKILPGRAAELAAALARYELRDFYGRDFGAALPAPFDAADPAVWREICEKAARKTRAFDVGYAFTPARSAALTPRALLDCWAALAPIYRALRQA